MKKIIFLLGLILTTLNNLNAQSLEMGQNLIHAGIGIGGKIGKYNYEKQSPSLHLQWERTALEIEGAGIITAGGYIGYKSYTDEGTTYDDYTYKQTWTYWVLGARTAFHVTAIKNKKLDVYGGLMASYNLLSYSYSDNDPYPNDSYSGAYASTQSVTVFAGARYFLTNRVRQGNYTLAFPQNRA